ncbi:uncharacterized protein si:ch211-214j24.10 [Syngnathoides biaculeatus]|uniref:uncharacterized protein si:ch211-214j24.10 n=1 Tax=Syngnathoides biaculeatus TaxID=300417 RepID=UPI002ADD3F3C|nr:uncharacterized protein si:ch211-214j24.10 [Syngnathoides biaculeatus]
MHIKTGTWEASNSVCESDTLCDPAVLVATANPEPHVRNRRLSPGNCGGGGGGGCLSGGRSRQLSPEADQIGPARAHPFGFRGEKERKGPQYKGRGLRRDTGQKELGRAQKVNRKDRWVEDSLSLLKPPPAFPVQDSPAKLQPAVSYASKVKAKATGAILEEDRHAIGVLLQNQWGLSFISETRPVPDPPAPQPGDTPGEPPLAIRAPQEAPAPFATSAAPATHPDLDENNGELLLSCRHLVEALNFHNREWNAICNKQKRDPKRVMWYKDFREHPA